jgi:hypothetical protein
MAHSIELLDVGHVLVDDKIVPVLQASSAATWSGGERHEFQTAFAQGYRCRAPAFNYAALGCA